MTKYKNVLLIAIAIILFIYASFISIFPAFVTSSFNINKFEQKMAEATGLDVTLGIIDFKIKPNFTTIIQLIDFDAKYPDEQPLFNAKYIEIETTPQAILSKNFNIKSMSLKNVTYNDQILPNGDNKLAYLPSSFNTKPFGKNKITITPGDIKIKNAKYIFTISSPYSYKEQSYRQVSYTKTDVKSFLLAQKFKNIVIK